MSFSENKTLMEEGDTVILYLGYDNLAQLQLTRGRVHQSRYGALKHDQLIGLPYGKKVECAKGWVCPLQPTPELWTLVLPHRTQILYTPDISMIVFQLHLKPGSVVVEAGTGSGSLSHALIRSVMPTGKLHTFEFHEERCLAARKEFEQHGLADFVIAKHKDVCAFGFGLNSEADAVFLDLPAPWECITSARQALRQGGRICTFSPCMEQVQKTCEALKDHGFSDLTTLECLARQFSVQNIQLSKVDFGDQTKENNTDINAAAAAKVAKSEREKSDPTEGMETGDTQNVSQTVCVGESQRTNKTSFGEGKKNTVKAREFKTAAPPLVMQGHTGFLTFASIYQK